MKDSLSFSEAMNLLKKEVEKAKSEKDSANTRSSRTSRTSRYGGLVHALRLFERVISQNDKLS